MLAWRRRSYFYHTVAKSITRVPQEYAEEQHSPAHGMLGGKKAHTAASPHLTIRSPSDSPIEDHRLVLLAVGALAAHQLLHGILHVAVSIRKHHAVGLGITEAHLLELLEQGVPLRVPHWRIFSRILRNCAIGLC